MTAYEIDAERFDQGIGKNNGLGAFGRVSEVFEDPDTDISTFSGDLIAQANKDGWIVISMEDDWKRFFHSKDDPVCANAVG